MNAVQGLTAGKFIYFILPNHRVEGSKKTAQTEFVCATDLHLPAQIALLF